MPRRCRSMNAPATRHIPVLGVEAVAQLAPHGGGIYIDATFGAGGSFGAAVAKISLKFQRPFVC